MVGGRRGVGMRLRSEESKAAMWENFDFISHCQNQKNLPTVKSKNCLELFISLRKKITYSKIYENKT